MKSHGTKSVRTEIGSYEADVAILKGDLADIRGDLRALRFMFDDFDQRLDAILVLIHGLVECDLRHERQVNL